MDPHVVPPVHPCTLGPQSGTSRRWWSRMRNKSKSDHRSMSVSWALGRWYFIGWICQRDIPKIFTFSLVIALPRRNSMQNLMAIRISFRLLVNGVPHGKNKATIKLVDVYVFDVSSVFEPCVRAWLHFQSASVRRTIQDTNCGFNLTSNIKNLRLGVKKSMRACNMHSSANTYCILCLARTKLRCQVALASQPSASRPTLVKEPCAQKLTALAWQTSGLKTQVSVVTAVYTGSGWSIRTLGPSDVLGQKKIPLQPYIRL